ncbi:hypothetical protein GG804_25270 [Sphingomonas histidinilytica]|uniref:hypothetical protein n=1 Tax=Rhizorhabdus histidinilytica TaxID=439228 RepID=UPI001ADB35E4|nr:hypothetical protein [Rhizorhabdus histidinilytica]MBO9380084.1 hypothetical protein [Rhizorhabdus histidinilytica]
MAIRFVPVAEINDPLTIALGISGASSTGKTFTSLRVARGIAEAITGKKGSPIGYVDTENKRALHYKAAFPEMAHFDFTAIDEKGELVGFGPERWIAVIDAAEAADLPVVIMDSFSHAWEGVGGVLDLHAQVLDRLVREAEARNQRYNNSSPVDPAKYSQLAWAEVKPRYRRLIDRIVRAKTNIIICTRAKPVMQQGFGDKAKNARVTKTRRQDVPWDPASDGDLMFEMTAMIILDPSAPGCPVYQVKVADQFKSLFDPRRPMSEETGVAMAEWAKGQGGAQKQKETMDLAREKARGGTDAFTKWWNSDDGKAARAVVRPIMEEIKILCATADEMASISDDEPFGRADEDHGEAHAFDADWLLEQINRKITAMDVNSLIGSHADTIAGFSEEDQERVDQARRARIDWIIAQSKAAAAKK